MTRNVGMPSRNWGGRTIPADLVERWHAEGFWDERSLGAVLAEGLAAHPSQTLTFHSKLRPWHGTFADLELEARRFAAGLAARGIGPGDVVACQLPNWSEAAAVIWGAALLGAVIVPIVHYYGRKEVDYIIERTQVRALVVASRFGRLDFLADASDRPALKALDVLAVVGDEDDDLPDHAIRYSELLAAQAYADVASVDPDSAALIAYTSGTTSDPKGVIHSHRTIGAEIRQTAQLLSATGKTPRLTPSPIGHFGGMLTGAFVPVTTGVPINFLDAWDPDFVLEIMTSVPLSAGSGATFFLTSLLNHPGLTPKHLELMHYVSLGGAAVPEAVARRATERGIVLTRNYGSSEHPTITGSRHVDPELGRITTDGRPLAGVELRIVDEDGNDLPAGEAGEILSRGPDCFIGYTDPGLTLNAFDADGWYRTEDIGVLDADGFLTITDRKKDVIIRGGENISAAEVEQTLLSRCDALSEIAVVSAPDPKYGEHPAAFVLLRSSLQSVTLQELRDVAAEAGLGRQKWPEELHIVTDFPRTPSGKIKKRELRDSLRR
jgi:acyl-CoA synthetase (AMP-forming)/AMP-acid ligase II